MIKNLLENLQYWQGAIEIDGVYYESVTQAQNSVSDADIEANSIILYSVRDKLVERKNLRVEFDIDKQYRITVRDYMTWPATEDFDFMKRWNNNKPMPCKCMEGIVAGLSLGMVYMRLHNDKTYWEGWIVKSAIIDAEVLDG